VRLLLDTNVLVAAFATRGVCAELLLHCARRHEIVTSAFILDEFRRVLISKLGVSAAEADAAQNLLRGKMKTVEPLNPRRRVCRDRQDDAVLGAALAGKCHALISGDKDLLVLEQFRGIRILSPAEFWKFENASW